MQLPVLTHKVILTLAAAVLLPLVGFSLFSAILVFPMFALLFDPSGTLRLLFIMGFVPSLATAAFFFLVCDRLPRLLAISLTALMSAASAAVWLGWLVPDSLEGRDGFELLVGIAAVASLALSVSWYIYGWRRSRKSNFVRG